MIAVAMIGFASLLLEQAGREAVEVDRAAPQAELEGVWIELRPRFGEETTGHRIPACILIIENGSTNRFVLHRDGKLVRESTFILDAENSPAHIDFETKSTGMRKTSLGIYRIDGDVLTILESSGTSRPAGFDKQSLASAGKPVFIQMYRRVRAKSGSEVVRAERSEPLFGD